MNYKLSAMKTGEKVFTKLEAGGHPGGDTTSSCCWLPGVSGPGVYQHYLQFILIVWGGPRCQLIQLRGARNLSLNRMRLLSSSLHLTARRMSHQTIFLSMNKFLCNVLSCSFRQYKQKQIISIFTQMPEDKPLECLG